MRITGGNLRNRILRVPRAGVRPTQDRLRESLFSSLGGRLDGWDVLDLFAGSGALGIEAWSRGAARVVWVERHPATFAVLQENIRALCGGAGDRCQAVRGSALEGRLLARLGGPFDLVLADPPYERGGGTDALEKTLQALADGSMLRPGGLLVFEQRSDSPPVLPAGWALCRDRVMGGSRLLFYRWERREQAPGGVA
jgi:16S rRNA (guanine966-N2)-methyltransferase